MKKLITLVLAILMIAVVVVGCQSKPAENPTGSKTPETTAPEAGDDFNPKDYSLAVCI